MVSAISLCLLAVGLTAVSSQLLSTEPDSSDVPVSDRRTFKHGKPVKVLPLVKKHKKFAGFVPHFGKTSYAQVPLAHDTLKPLYKVHRYQGIEVKPVSDVSVSTPESIIDAHSAEPPSDFEPAFSPDYSFPGPISSTILLYPVNDKPIFSPPAFSAPPPSTLPPPPPPKPVFQFVPAPPQPVFPSLPITSVPSLISIPRPVPPPVFSHVPAFQPPLFTSLPASFPSNPPQPVFSPIPIKVQPPVLPPLPSPSPAPIFSSVPIKIPPPVLPQIPASPSPSPPPVFPPVSVTPPPLPQHLPSISPPLPHAFPSLSPPLPNVFPSIPPPSLPPVLAPSPFPISSLPPLPSPAPNLPTISIPAPPEPNFPYPPSGVPIPSFIKDISLGDVHIKDTPLPTVETPTVTDETLNHPSIVKTEDTLLQKLKGWKADKATAALAHFSNFKQKPFPQFSIPIPHPSNKIPSSHTPAYSTPSHPLPLAQAPVFFPSYPQFLPPPKYESFPPNNIEPPPVFNSYGVPIPHDSYAPAHASHDRLSSAASEEDPAVVPPPSKDQATPQKQLLQEFQTHNFQQQSTSHVREPVYVPEDPKTVNEEGKAPDDSQPEVDDYSAPKEPGSENTVPDPQAYSNHKE